ncbi:COG1470 family protein [Desulfatiglans anilini]|uniref:COG1470 family protein n=1 Tax=Desulfatiglans anilini TaxID=90728 RepID=UPI000414A64B|nr:NEW3 domain-containing protein [Desulfatiglans anilini]
MEGRRNRRLGWALTGMLLSLVCFAGTPAPAEEKQDLPERKISVAVEYPGIVIPRGEDLSLDLIVTNGGRTDEAVELMIQPPPDGWTAQLKTYRFGVRGVFVKADSSKTVTLDLEQDETLAPGEYTFTVEGRSSDGALRSTAELRVAVEGEKTERKAEGAALQTAYPVLRGPTDGRFEFSVEVESRLEEDAVFSLTGQAPENWEVNFKPAYEDKFISSLRLKARQSQSVAVEVEPAPQAAPGEYPILVRVKTPGAQAETQLTVILTGTYRLEMATTNELLSLSAVKGNSANLSFYVRNSGSAPLQDIHFLSFKPENWTVEFEPGQIEILAPDELKQVEATITPGAEALVGDYSLALSAEAGKLSKNLELRVTVKASVVWGWVGIGLIIGVLAGLVFLFMRLGRR